MKRPVRKLPVLGIYGAALAATLAALAISLVTQRISATPSYVAFVAAVAFAARFGGKGPALFTSVISLGLIDYYLVPPLGVIDFRQPEQGVNVVVFAAVAFMITSMTTRLRRAEREAKERAEMLGRVNAALQEQMEEVHSLDESLHDANEFLSDARDAAARLANGALRLQTATESLSKAATVADVAGVALASIATLMPVAQGALYLRRGDCLNVLATSGERTEIVKPVNLAGRSAADAPDPVTFAALTDDVVWVDGRGDEPSRFAAAGRPWPFHVSIPLVSGDEHVGVLALNATVAPPGAEAERSLLRLFGHAVANAVVRARQYDAERGGREAAETLARAREEVLGVVAHDLRNPLALVGSSVEMLAELGDDPSRRHEMIDITRRAVKRMNGLIGDLLDITRLQAGHLALDSRALTVNDVFRQAVEGWTALLAERQIALHVVFPRAELQIEADPGRIAQVFDNLIGNARKFTPAGGRVVVRAEADPQGGVRFCVSDSGPGMTPEAQARLFDRFWQARRADRRGIGLGLTICKGIVEAHGGRIWCESTLGAGTRFYFTIPAPTADEARQISA